MEVVPPGQLIVKASTGFNETMSNKDKKEKF